MAPFFFQTCVPFPGDTKMGQHCKHGLHGAGAGRQVLCLPGPRAPGLDSSLGLRGASASYVDHPLPSTRRNSKRGLFLQCFALTPNPYSKHQAEIFPFGVSAPSFSNTGCIHQMVRIFGECSAYFFSSDYTWRPTSYYYAPTPSVSSTPIFHSAL